MEDYVVTGIGLYNSMGRNVNECWDTMLLGNTGISTFVWPEEDPTRLPKTYNSLTTSIGAKSKVDSITDSDNLEIFGNDWKYWDKFNRAGMLLANEALMDSGLTSKNVGVFYATGTAGKEVSCDMYANINSEKIKYSPKKAMQNNDYFLSTTVANIYGLTGPTLNLNSTCTTTLMSIELAINHMTANKNLDAMLIAGIDFPLDPLTLYWFQNLGALSKSPCVPFDINRDGISIGEGGGALIIEPRSKAIARGAKIYGTISAVVNTTSYYSATGPDPSGIPTFECMKAVLDKAGLTADQIDYVNAHATGTPIGDIAEYDALCKLFTNQPIVSFKGQLGHCMSAGGAVELICTMLALRDNVTPPNVGLKTKMGKGELNLITETTKLINPIYAMKNNFGFGGRNASLIYRKELS